MRVGIPRLASPKMFLARVSRQSDTFKIAAVCIILSVSLTALGKKTFPDQQNFCEELGNGMTYLLAQATRTDVFRSSQCAEIQRSSLPERCLSASTVHYHYSKVPLQQGAVHLPYMYVTVWLPKSIPATASVGEYIYLGPFIQIQVPSRLYN